MPKNIVLAFDLYGTLLSTESIAKQLATHFGDDKAATIAVTWRKYQLEYTWRANSMGMYEDFSTLTRRALRHALAESKVSLRDDELDAMMRAYDSLSIFPDVAPTMDRLKTTPDLRAVIFSNGTHGMVSSSVNKSPGLSPYAKMLDELVLVGPCRVFKPAAEVYRHLARSVGKDPDDAQAMADVWLVTGNPFDVVGARAAGINAIWVDRTGAGWQDALVEGEKGRPTEVVKSLEQVVTTVMSDASDDLTQGWREMHG